MNLGELGPTCVGCGRDRGHETCVEKQVIALLTEIRDELRTLRQVLLEPPPEMPPAPCTHPPDRRTDDNPGATFWKCKSCGYLYDSEQEIH